MLKDVRDFAIILWIAMQGFSWFMPESYGMFEAQADLSYNQWAERLGMWEE